MALSNTEFVAKLVSIPAKYVTAYATGTFGQKATSTVISSKAKQYPKQYTAAKVEKLKALPDDARLFDCCGLIKAVLWGFPNTVYTSNGVQDLSDAGLWNVAIEKTTDLKKVPIGGLLHMKGHVGVKISETQAIDCSTKWNCVKIHDLFTRGWIEGGKLPYISYNSKTVEPIIISNDNKTSDSGQSSASRLYTVKSGDCLSSIGNKLNVDWKEIATLNNIKQPYRLYIGQTLKIPSRDVKIYYTVKAGDTMSKIAAMHKTTVAILKTLNPQIKNINVISIGQKVRVK